MQPELLLNVRITVDIHNVSLYQGYNTHARLRRVQHLVRFPQIFCLFIRIEAYQHVRIAFFEMGDVRACVSSVVKNALTVADQETGTKMRALSLILFHSAFIRCPEIALGDLSVLTVMNTALAYVPAILPLLGLHFLILTMLNLVKSTLTLRIKSQQQPQLLLSCILKIRR
jgi:hypothetical protein